MPFLSERLSLIEYLRTISFGDCGLEAKSINIMYDRPTKLVLSYAFS
jgi:hypothetical protein